MASFVSVKLPFLVWFQSVVLYVAQMWHGIFYSGASQISLLSQGK